MKKKKKVVENKSLDLTALREKPLFSDAKNHNEYFNCQYI